MQAVTTYPCRYCMGKPENHLTVVGCEVTVRSCNRLFHKIEEAAAGWRGGFQVKPFSRQDPLCAEIVVVDPTNDTLNYIQKNLGSGYFDLFTVSWKKGIGHATNTLHLVRSEPALSEKLEREWFFRHSELLEISKVNGECSDYESSRLMEIQHLRQEAQRSEDAHRIHFCSRVDALSHRYAYSRYDGAREYSQRFVPHAIAADFEPIITFSPEIFLQDLDDGLASIGDLLILHLKEREGQREHHLGYFLRCEREGEELISITIRNYFHHTEIVTFSRIWLDKFTVLKRKDGSDHPDSRSQLRDTPSCLREPRWSSPSKISANFLQIFGRGELAIRSCDRLYRVFERAKEQLHASFELAPFTKKDAPEYRVIQIRNSSRFSAEFLQSIIDGTHKDLIGEKPIYYDIFTVVRKEREGVEGEDYRVIRTEPALDEVDRRRYIELNERYTWAEETWDFFAYEVERQSLSQQMIQDVLVKTSDCRQLKFCRRKDALSLEYCHPRFIRIRTANRCRMPRELSEEYERAELEEIPKKQVADLLRRIKREYEPVIKYDFKLFAEDVAAGFVNSTQYVPKKQIVLPAFRSTAFVNPSGETDCDEIEFADRSTRVTLLQDGVASSVEKDIVFGDLLILHVHEHGGAHKHYTVYFEKIEVDEEGVVAIIVRMYLKPNKMLTFFQNEVHAITVLRRKDGGDHPDRCLYLRETPPRPREPRGVIES